MTKPEILKFPDRQVIDEEAAEWLIRLDSDRDRGAGERAELREWLSRSAVHREALRELAVLWDRMNVLTELSVPLGGQVQDAKALPKRGVRARFGLRLAAVGVATILSVALGLSYWLRTSDDGWLTTNGLYATAVGQQSETRLADGSVVLLNTNSQIRVEYGETYRDIRLLQGEAYFTVAKHELLPFRVFAGNGHVQAVGTAFAVHLTDEGVNVTVTEGTVRLAVQAGSAAANDSPVEELGTLSAGQHAVFSTGGEQTSDAEDAVALQREESDAAKFSKRLSWREGVLIFNGEPLETVLGEISRYTTLTIDIADPALRSIKVGGRFPVSETEFFLQALETNFGIRVTRSGRDHVSLSAANDQS